MTHLIRMLSEGVRPVDKAMLVLEFIIVLIMTVELIRSVVAYGLKKYRLSHTFSLTFSAYEPAQNLTIGSNTLHIWARARRGVEISAFQFKLAHTRRRRALSAHTAYIKDIRLCPSEIYLEKDSDGRGGYIGQFRHPRFASEGKVLSFQILIDVLAAWSGRLIFECRDTQQNVYIAKLAIHFTVIDGSSETKLKV
jgi:hypothetical protein